MGRRDRAVDLVRLTLAQLQTLAAYVGFPNPNLLAAIAMAESFGETTALNDTRGLTDDQIRAKFGLPAGTRVAQEFSMGLWQINMLSAPGNHYTPEQLADPVTNAQVAFAISNGGTNLTGPWYTTMTTGRYKPWYSPTAPQPPVVRPPDRDNSGIAMVAALAVAAAGAYAALRSRELFA